MSSTIAIDFILPWTQATATSLQTVFDATWTADDADDVIVYARGTGVAADDAAQIISSADYVVTFVGTDEDVRVTFSVGRTLDDIVTLTRKTPTSRLNLYSNTNFNPTMLNGDFNKLVMMLQERVLENLILPDAASASTRLSPKYNNSESLTYPNDAILPILTAGGIWRKNDGNTAIEEATIPAFPVGSGADFTNDNRMVKTDTSGTDNNVQETGMTVDDSDNITGINNITVNSVQFPTNPPVSGQVIAATSATTSRWSNAGDGDVDGPPSSTDNSTARFSGIDGKLIQNSGVIIDDSNAITGITSLTVDNMILDGNTLIATTGILRVAPAAGSVLQLDDSNFTVDGGVAVITGDLTVDNLNLNGNALTSASGTVDITPLSGQDLNIVVDSGGEVNLTGAMLFNHTATENDDHALEIDCDAAGFSDVKGIDLAYTTGASAATEEEAAILISINETASTGGEVSGLEILSTAEGSADIYGLSGFVNVNPVLQSSGTFTDMDSALNIAVDVLAALSSGGAGNISGFVADNDTMTIGDAAKFEEMEWILGTGASGAGIAPTYEYSNGAGPTTFTPFGPIDGTNGMRNTGAIAWLVGDLPGWVVGDSGEFEIRITRTRNSLSTTPIIDEVQIAATTEYKWDKDGDINLKSVDIDASEAYKVAGTAILSDAAGTMTLSNVDALDATTAATNSAVNFAADAEGSDTYVIALSPALGSYVTGKEISFTANTINTGACTLNVNGLGAIALKKLHDQDPSNGDIEAGAVVTVVYDGTNFQITSQIALASGPGTVTSVATGTGLQGGPITSSGTINLATQNALGGRLTLTTATPVTTADVTAATTIYFTPYKGQDADIYTGSAWARFQLTELSIAVPATTDTAYDLFLDYNSGTPALATEAWSSVTARNTALAYQDGVLVLSGTATKRYIGSFVTTGVSGETEDSAANRYVWNYYNRVDRPLYKAYADTSWTYTSTTVRQAAGSTTNQVELMIGVAEDTIKFRTGTSSVGEAGDGYIMGVGVNSTTTMEDTEVCVSYSNVATLSPTYVSFEKIIPIGYSYLASLESIVGTGTTTVYSSLGALKSHIIGSLKG